MPRVSVVIPTYNCESYIGEAVGSVLKQTFQDFEIIVIDDGSTDRTRSVLEPYMDRIIYLYQENQGESVARNRGIKMAKSEFIAFLDSDDLWLPIKLERQLNAMDAYTNAVLVYSYSYNIDEGGERIQWRGSDLQGQGKPGLHHMLHQIIMTNVIANIGAVMVRKSFLTGMTLFDPEIQLGEDWDFYIRLSLLGPFAFIPEPLASVRIRGKERRLRIEASSEYVRQNEQFLSRIFDMVSERQVDLQQLRPHVFGALYVKSAMCNFALGETDIGANYLLQATKVHPESVRDAMALVQRVSAESLRFIGDSRKLSQGVAFINRVFDHLPSQAEDLRGYRSKALSEFHMAAAFRHFELGNRNLTWQQVIQAIFFDPACARNLGLLSIGLQSLIGGKPWAKLHRSGEAGI
jgi:glycosyltransferase involved in cell wall biosynthesis